MAGVGIVRRRVWSAYGFALFLSAQLLLLPVVLSRSGGLQQDAWGVAGAAGVTAALIALFYAAGKSLRASGARPGLAWPWIAGSAVCALAPVFVQPFVMPTNSMAGTLLAGDRVLVRRLPKPAPARGDLVTFLYPVDRRQVFVKRVIGAPGDRIRISNKIVYRNGAPLAEPYAAHTTSYMDSYRDNFPGEPGAPIPRQGMEMLAKHVKDGEVVVPQGNYFVLGDNRDDSLDSRYWGFVPASDVVGKPILIYD
ncbi:MAG: signal peptidase I, partial [Acidobacteriia bacterium]|nr:signal peptidase I [Terriglobia bacterium]